MAEAVIDLFEVIDVRDRHRAHRGGSIGGQRRERLLKRTPVGQPGERIDQRLAREHLAFALQLLAELAQRP